MVFIGKHKRKVAALSLSVIMALLAVATSSCKRGGEEVPPPPPGGVEQVDEMLEEEIDELMQEIDSLLDSLEPWDFDDNHQGNEELGM